MKRPRILVLDNVDSFTFMLVDYLLSLGADVRVERSDHLSAEAALDLESEGVLISPGPGTPEDAGISLELSALCIERHHPLLGICLGHQAMALACGSPVERVRPVHGKIAAVRHDGSGLFAGTPSPLSATRYHSLAVSDPRPPLIPNAWSEDGTVMAVRHERAPAHGLQFHPESVASECGKPLLDAFLRLCRENA